MPRATIIATIACTLIYQAYSAAAHNDTNPPDPSDLPDVQDDIEWGFRAFGALIASALVSF